MNFLLMFLDSGTDGTQQLNLRKKSCGNDFKITTITRKSTIIRFSNILKEVNLKNLSDFFYIKDFVRKFFFTLSSDIHKPYRANRNKILKTSIHKSSRHHL